MKWIFYVSLRKKCWTFWSIEIWESCQKLGIHLSKLFFVSKIYKFCQVRRSSCRNNAGMNLPAFEKNTKYAFEPCLIPKWLYIFSMFLSLWAVFICCILTSCILCMLKGVWHEIFSFKFFFMNQFLPGPYHWNWFMKKSEAQNLVSDSL